jgi:hypothetical protein
MLDVVLPTYEPDPEDEEGGGDAPLWRRGGSDVRELYRARRDARCVTYFNLHTPPTAAALDDTGRGAGASPDVFSGDSGASIAADASARAWLQPLRGEPGGFRCWPHPGPCLDVLRYLPGALEEADKRLR